MTETENDRLDRIESRLERIEHDLESLVTEVRQTNEGLEKEAKRTDERFEKWDERFFQLARDTKNISVGLIVSAVVAILLSSIMK